MSIMEENYRGGSADFALLLIFISWISMMPYLVCAQGEFECLSLKIPRYAPSFFFSTCNVHLNCTFHICSFMWLNINSCQNTSLFLIWDGQNDEASTATCRCSYRFMYFVQHISNNANKTGNIVASDSFRWRNK